jgi:hypothetical protein
MLWRIQKFLFGKYLASRQDGQKIKRIVSGDKATDCRFEGKRTQSQ